MSKTAHSEKHPSSPSIANEPPLASMRKSPEMPRHSPLHSRARPLRARPRAECTTPPGRS
eukprot:6509898-Pyramimonas_sp.AAC.1